ncbi:c-type cytochrome [Flavobacterium sp. MAH-1]|uniref:C-type cytochrome n=1 Tax=Flavobacterium agri TaxID=2743471 RepID=A0A7Y9C669_9FLAO|nr:di-heme oxidoredictase family protein [Flavobacterium agri]NUY82052.1 c-type cytochrome [Flavobacterium agri]NYA72076.1 c-type cytochrome [Flavobacterium agri]
MKKVYRCLLGAVLFLSVSACSDSDSDYQPLTPEEGEQFSGGSSTVFNSTEEAFGFASSAITPDQASDFGVGNSFFRQNWVMAPSSTTARDGLGPFYNAISCASCHFKDGRGRPPSFDGEFGKGLLLRLSVAGTDAFGGQLPDPIYGGQLQDKAIFGQTAKGDYTISYETIIETLADGTTVELRKPIYHIQNLAYGDMATNVMVSPRIANQIIGMGLLEAIPQQTILDFIDSGDSNGDGIVGKANYVRDYTSNTTKLGRFGWKANQPSIRQQVAMALHQDMGLTTSLFSVENCPPGIDCNAIPNGGTPEVPDLSLDRMVLYSQALSVPARRNLDDQSVLRGKQIFAELNCIGCHKPKIQTGSDYTIAGMRNQTIRPYTDLLLHDMGDGLADNANDYLANGREWRTQPLWGIGLINTVNGHTNLLHDGRARNVTEAILWHAGEATNSKNAFKQLNTSERTDLLNFINSL